MANIKSQIKRNKQNEVRHERNKGVRSELKSRVKAARDAVEGNDKDAPDKIRLAQKRLGKAGAKGRIHKNQAARRTSRLMKRTANKPNATKTTAKKSPAKKAPAKKKTTAKKS
jgi:small subunit ribosomal protein S20